jgi:hypothetical protein
MKGDIYGIIGKVLVVVIPALAIVGFAVPTVLRMNSLSLLSTYLAVPMLLGTAAYLLFCRNIDGSAPLPAASPLPATEKT